MFEAVKNWGRWGADDQRGTLNYITPDHVRRAAGLVKSGRSVSMAIPINTVAGPDNQSPAIHHMTQMFDLPIDSTSLRFGMDFLGMSCHGDCHTHIDALCHIAYGGHVYGGRPESLLTSHGGTALDIAAYANGIVGRGVLLDIPRVRGTAWLEPGEAVTRAELEAAEKAEGVRLGEGDLPDGDGETVPGTVDGILYPIHPLQIVAMGMVASDSLNLEDIAAACEEEKRWEFLVVAEPLRLPGGTGSPFNPIAVL